MTVVDSYTVKDAMKFCGYKTAYMLDYLYRTGIVRPSKLAAPGRGRRRLYTFRDLVLLRSVHHLLSRGLPVKKLKRAIETMRRKFPKVPFEGQVGPERYILTNGSDVYLVNSESGIFDLASEGQMAFLFMLDVETIRNEVTAEIAKIEAKAVA